MKNNYNFCKLGKVEIDLEQNEKAAIFFKMLSLLEQDQEPVIVPSLEELNALMKHDLYFIAHKYISYKGKTGLFLGDFALSSKKSIFAFIKNAIEADDLRPLLLAPFFESAPEYVYTSMRT